MRLSLLCSLLALPAAAVAQDQFVSHHDELQGGAPFSETTDATGGSVRLGGRGDARIGGAGNVPASHRFDMVKAAERPALPPHRRQTSSFQRLEQRFAEENEQTRTVRQTAPQSGLSLSEALHPEGLADGGRSSTLTTDEFDQDLIGSERQRNPSLGAATPVRAKARRSRTVPAAAPGDAGIGAR